MDWGYFGYPRVPKGCHNRKCAVVVGDWRPNTATIHWPDTKGSHHSHTDVPTVKLHVVVVLLVAVVATVMG